jgi:hypothetical protein
VSVVDTRVVNGRRRRGLGERALLFVIILALTSEKSIEGRREDSSRGK